MARTKRKRRSKHRGTAAGTIETRGRTGRRPEPAKKGDGKGGASTGGKSRTRGDARERRMARLDRPPTLRGAINRAALATVMFFVTILLLIHNTKPAGAVAIAGFMFLIYVPMSYYTDFFIYRRRQRRKSAGSQSTR